MKTFLPTLTNGIPSYGTYCDFHIKRTVSLFSSFEGEGVCRIANKLCVSFLYKFNTLSISTSSVTYPVYVSPYKQQSLRCSAQFGTFVSCVLGRPAVVGLYKNCSLVSPLCCCRLDKLGFCMPLSVDVIEEMFSRFCDEEQDELSSFNDVVFDAFIVDSKSFTLMFTGIPSVFIICTVELALRSMSFKLSEEMMLIPLSCWPVAL